MVSPDQASPASRAQTAILLIDDQRFVGLALARLLEGEPEFQLHCCEHGAEAAAMAARLQPDLILQDLVMPDVDGLTLVRAFRQAASTARTPIVVLSGNDDEATRARALAAGADDYLVKLPPKDVLLDCLRRQLSHRAAVAAAVTAHTPVTPGGDVLDPDVLAAYRDEGTADPDGALRALVRVFLNDAEVQMTGLRTAVASRAAMVASLAHAMKGCALAIGARQLAALCARLELAEEPHPAVVLERIEAELVRVKAACAGLTQGRQRCGI